MPEFQFGDIVDVNVFDPNQQNPKVRPILLISRSEDIANSDNLAGIAISSSEIPPKPNKLPEDWIELPYSSAGTCNTGLRKRSVLKCQWLVRFRKDDILCKRGFAP